MCSVIKKKKNSGIVLLCSSDSIKYFPHAVPILLAFWSIFSLIFYVTLSMKTMILRSNHLRRMRGRGISTKSVFSVLEHHYDHFWSCQIFIFDFYSSIRSLPETKKLFAQLDTGQNRWDLANGLRLAGHLIFWSRDNLGSTFTRTQILREGVQRD